MIIPKTFEIQNKTNNKTAIWMRVSTKEQTSENQLEQLHRKAYELGLEVVKTYDVTGSAYKNAHEPAIRQVINDSKWIKFNNLIVFDLSRISRLGINQTINILLRLKRNGIKVYSCNPAESFLDPDMNFDQLMIALYSFKDNEDSLDRSRRTRAGRLRAKKEGKHIGRPKGSKDKRPRNLRGYFMRREIGI